MRLCGAGEPMSNSATATQPWPEVVRETIATTRVFEVQLAQRRSPRTGQVHPFGVLVCPDWVNVVAITPDGFAVLVEQFRHGTESVTLEVAGGMVDPGETPEHAARRELLEETGYVCEELREIGWVYPNPALQTNRCFTFLAVGCTLQQVAEFDATEDCALRLAPVAALPELVRSGAIRHALVVAALAHAWLAGELAG